MARHFDRNRWMASHQGHYKAPVSPIIQLLFPVQNLISFHGARTSSFSSTRKLERERREKKSIFVTYFYPSYQDVELSFWESLFPGGCSIHGSDMSISNALWAYSGMHGNVGFDIQAFLGFGNGGPVWDWGRFQRFTNPELSPGISRRLIHYLKRYSLLVLQGIRLWGSPCWMLDAGCDEIR